MRVKISWQGMKKDGGDEGLVEKKLSSLGKFVKSFKGKVGEIKVVVRKTFKRGYRVSLFLKLPSKGIQTKGSGEKMMVAVVEARKKMEKKLKKHMAQLRGMRKRKGVKKR